MAIYYPPEEARLIQERSVTSAADALFLDIAGPVPGGHIWTLETIGVSFSAAETQNMQFQKISRSGAILAVFNPFIIACPANMRVTFLEQGLTIVLYQGETLRFRRAGATAGTTITGVVQFIESDMPLYRYIDPQSAARLKTFGTQVAERAAFGGAGGGPGGGPAPVHGGRSRPPVR